ncbi:uncharacterized protein A4U43_C09F15700 [Asparagus officinalis]|uniref:HIRAN domain-containing protein n=1 Tax=Asparagus officinalis TaxID=4686 RepID=A0A5P1E9Q6_ASPOF|nr:uncharacterized protein A4U43_C09F15700 [Asparagus officinalis]
MPKRGCIDYNDLVNKATVLLRQCRSVLQSVDPVSCLRTLETSHSAEIIGSENSDRNEGEIDGNRNEQRPLGSSTNVETSDSVEIIGFKNSDRNNGILDEDGVEERPLGSKTNFEQDKRNGCNGDFQENGEIGFFSDGRMFFLNRLENMSPSLPGEPKTVTLPELLHPVGSLVRVFMATFTSDVSWFLSYCQLPYHLPITIACHGAQRCWSANHESRTAAPYSNYPNLLLVYPPFPEVIAFGKDRKKQGVACHHPKLIVLQRKESIRVIVTSANLTPKQWNYVTNTVWLQDFPSRSSPDFSTLFSTIEDSLPDFAPQLGGFIASLISDVPSQAHWIAELTKYDFGGAVGHLVASIPGMHVKKSSYSETDLFILGKHSGHSQSTSMKYLGSAQVSVVGLGHRFHTAADSNGAQLKTLASFLGKFQGNARSTLEVLLKRNINIPADSNAMSVFVADVDEFSEGDSVQLGFLPRDTARWVSPLHDAGFFSFSAFIHPMETLAAVLGSSNTKVPLLLHVSQGANFVEISRLIQPDHIAPLCSLMASIQRPLGIWRLQEVLSQYKWPEMLETDFIYSSSSVGTSVNPQFIAAFSAAAGKRSANLPESEESDPEWGCWTTNHELRNASIKFLFPTIDRVKSGRHGVQPSRCLLSLPEKTWQRLRPAGIFHDAIPHPSNRLGYPMHVKVARRRFQSRTAGIPPFGWIYCGSHNFSPAAWGQVLLPSSESNILGPRLHICNYELGVILIVPPSDSSNYKQTGIKSRPDCAGFLMSRPSFVSQDMSSNGLANGGQIPYNLPPNLNPLGCKDLNRRMRPRWL